MTPRKRARPGKPGNHTTTTTTTDESQTPSSTSSCVDREVDVSSAAIPEITASSYINDTT